MKYVKGNNRIAAINGHTAVEIYTSPRITQVVINNKVALPDFLPEYSTAATAAEFAATMKIVSKKLKSISKKHN